MCRLQEKQRFSSWQTMPALRETFEKTREAYQNLAGASDVSVQADKNGIEDDAVSVVIPGATLYLPLEDLVDFEKEKERLLKEKERLTKELARSRGMLSNEKFLSKAPETKVQEEKRTRRLRADDGTGRGTARTDEPLEKSS